MTGDDEELSRVRAGIDALDRKVIAALAEREQLVRRAGRLKADAAAVRAPARVEQVIARVRGAAVELGADPAVVEATYRAMIAAFVGLELVQHASAPPGRSAGATSPPTSGSPTSGSPTSGAELPDEPGWAISRAERRDVGELLTLQRAAYATEAQLYGDPSLPALVESLGDLAQELGTGTVLKAVVGHRIVGAVRARLVGDVLHVGRLTVAPDQQGRGIGGALMSAIEQAAVPALSATLFTGHLSAGNLAFYEGLGYVEERREPLTKGIELVHLSKNLT